MIDQSLGRNVKVRIYATTVSELGTGLQISYSNGYTEFASVMPDGSPGFRIKGKVVEVQPTVQFNTNQINLALYNLGASSRSVIQSMVGTKLTILAGYGDNPKQIAEADILWARTHKEGPDFITEIIAGDSHFGLANGVINQSFKGPISYQQVVSAIFSKLEDSNISPSLSVDIPDGGYKNGFVLTGSPMIILSDVCKTMNRSLSIKGGIVYILPIGQDVGAPIIELSEDTGLIGIPEVQSPGVIGVVPAGTPVSPDLDVSFTHLLRADLTLSQRVRIKSKFINGEYVIGRNVYDFDSWSGPFYNRCEAFKVLKNVG